MDKFDPKRIVYLFGAGATHAEITNCFPSWFAWFVDTAREGKESLLLKDVSLRKFRDAKKRQPVKGSSLDIGHL